ncbi:restriction endonuclease [Neobacillus sp. 179-C4.2 HS]|uniref:Restriction endonuclease n=1 Tax=Neobacillus driksii TaxID=3035913 RepID=A0ABV4YSF8_9BACI|nr:restriction endonuclease [Neobacillus sp. 179.-C4.2 HS]
MGGFEFEEYIGQLLTDLGYQNVKITPKSGDGGVDITAKDVNGYKVAVQCKRLKSKVGNSAIQEVYLGKKLENCKRAIVITNSYFTKPAIEAATKTQVELWDRDKLIEQMRKVEIKITWEDFLRQHYNAPKQEPMNYKNFAL